MADLKTVEKKFSYVSGLIYGDSIENIELFDYFKKVGYFKYAYILHNKDFKENGEPEKPHFHILVKLGYAMRLSSAQKFFGGFFANDYLEGVPFPDYLLLYFLHRTPEAYKDDRKFKYDISCLCGDNELIKRIKQNSHFVQLADLCYYARRGFTLSEALEDFNEDCIDDYIDYLEKHSYLAFSAYRMDYEKWRANNVKSDKK